MSRSSLWVMNNNFNGVELEEFSNSWLLTPVSLDILFEKYLPIEAKNPYGKTNYITASMFDKSIFDRLNNKINNSEIKEDRVLWELGNQQVFFTKDKEFVAKSLKEFLIVNSRFTQDLGQHIFERFNKVAEAILNINEDKYPYFIFKNTSCDDNVEYWFEKYSEEDDECLDRSLKELGEVVTEFVVIENNKILKFINNVDYFGL